ncbi:MAG: hypothetical protein AAB965_04150, partial [Patescibacteria group bacterium]
MNPGLQQIAIGLERIVREEMLSVKNKFYKARPYILGVSLSGRSLHFGRDDGGEFGRSNSVFPS